MIGKILSTIRLPEGFRFAYSAGDEFPYVGIDKDDNTYYFAVVHEGHIYVRYFPMDIGENKELIIQSHVNQLVNEVISGELDKASIKSN